MWVFKRTFTYKKVNYGIKLFRTMLWCWVWWTPFWHNGRGPYISISLGWIHFYRGY